MSDARRTRAPRRFHGVVDEAARLGVSRSWLYTEIKAGRFPHCRMGTRLLIDPTEVDAFLEQSSVTASEAVERVER